MMTGLIGKTLVIMTMLQHLQPTVLMLSTSHLSITSLESKNDSTGKHMKSSRSFTMDQAVNVAISYSSRHSSGKLIKFVFAKNLSEMFSFSTTNCYIVESSSRELVRFPSQMEGN